MIASRTFSIGMVALCGLCGGFAATPVRAGFYDVARDFSPTANPNGVWSYGESLTLGSPFILSTIHQNTGGLDFWEGSIPTGSPPGLFPYVTHNGTGSTINYTNTTSISAGQLGLHPGPDGEYSIVRFTSPAAGSYLLVSAFSGLDFSGPTSTDVHILLDGTSIFDSNVNSFGSGPSFSQTLALRAGDTVDFEVGYGINHSYSNDLTGLAATLSTGAVPEPGSLILAGIGAVMMVCHGWWRELRVRSPFARCPGGG